MPGDGDFVNEIEQLTCGNMKEVKEVDVWPSDLSGLVGKRIKYKYGNGWEYEVYYKSTIEIDYRVVSGPIGGRCVKGQHVHMRQLRNGQPIYMISWSEPTGTCVSQIVDLDKNKPSVQAVIFFPHWVIEDPSKTVISQTCPESRRHMNALRDVGPSYPTHVINESALIHSIEDFGPSIESIILPPPSIV